MGWTSRERLTEAANALLAHLARGDLQAAERAWLECWAAGLDRVAQAVARSVVPASSVDDVMQETQIKVLGALRAGELRPASVGMLIAFVCTVTRHVAVDHMRRHGRESLTSRGDPVLEAAVDPAAAAAVRRLDAYTVLRAYFFGSTPMHLRRGQAIERLRHEPRDTGVSIETREPRTWDELAAAEGTRVDSLRNPVRAFIRWFVARQR
jgi:DNA-directed RNA polymerase specialized sigma24 family protein